MLGDDVLKRIPAAYSGCSYDETCRNMKVMEALRVQLVAATKRADEAEQLLTEWGSPATLQAINTIGVVATRNRENAEMMERQRDEANLAYMQMRQERDAASVRERVLREAGNELYAAVSYAVDAGERLDPTFRWPNRLQRITDALKGLGEALATAPAATPEVKL